MRVPKINLLKPQNENPQRKKIKTLLKILSAFIIIFVGLFFISSFILSYVVPWDTTQDPSVMERITSLLPSLERKLVGEREDRINILLLGMGGAGHEGPYLTDTIILASFRPKEKKAVLLSIPRDLVVPMSDYGWRKVNNINAFAEAKKTDSGGEETRKALSSVLDISIPYYIRADFSGFKKLIDDLGGITINVERDFTDNMYPTEDFKTQTVSFPQGWQVMDGEKALQFVRSRHGNNEEGTDFARSKRQQKLILAIKDKIFSISTLLSPLRLIEALQTTKAHINTNLEIWEVMRLGNMAKGLENEDILTHVLDDSENGLLQAENYEGAYVLLPKNGWAELKNFVNNIFTDTIKEKITRSKLAEIKIEVQNGTKINGLASTMAEKLGDAGLNILYYGNAPKQDFEKTAIFNLTEKNKKEVLEKIQGLLGGQIFNKNELPDNITPTTCTQSAEILIILGSDQATHNQ